ncbi:MAG: hypothetical protein WCD44_00195 [Candidatus Babeliales bacterium]
MIKKASPIFLIASNPIKKMTYRPLLETQKTDKAMQDLILPSQLYPASKKQIVKIIITATSCFTFKCPVAFQAKLKTKRYWKR